MKRRAAALVLVCVMLPAVAQKPPAIVEPSNPNAAASSSKPAALALGERLCDNSVVIDLDGQPRKLRELLGKWTVINFHSTMATSQRASDERFAELQAEFAAAGVAFLHINSNANEVGLRVQKAVDPKEQDSKELGSEQQDATKPYSRLRKYLAAHKLPFRMFVDHHNRVADSLGATRTPQVLVFHAEGRLLYRGQLRDAKRDYLGEVLRQLVRGDELQPFETKPSGDAIARATPDQVQIHGIVTDDAALAKETAIRAGKLLLYNFTGFNSGSSRILEGVVFEDDAVREMMRDHLLEARLHTDAQNNLSDAQFANNRKLQADLAGSTVSPCLVIVDAATGQKLATLTLSGDVSTWAAKWHAVVKQAAAAAGRAVR